MDMNNFKYFLTQFPKLYFFQISRDFPGLENFVQPGKIFQRISPTWMKFISVGFFFSNIVEVAETITKH